MQQETTYTIIVQPIEGGRYAVEVPEFGLKSTADTPQQAQVEGDRLVAQMYYERAQREIAAARSVSKLASA